VSQNDWAMLDAAYIELYPGVYLKDRHVIVDGLDPMLQAFLKALGLVHPTLFGLPVIVTSGKDGVHVLSSKHSTGGAVDIRVDDKRLAWRFAFLLVCEVLSDQFGLCLFDEGNLKVGPHLHIEVAG
jgi:hypothetical protein